MLNTYCVPGAVLSANLNRVRLTWTDFPSRFCGVALGVSIFSPVNCDANTCPRVGIKGDKPPHAISEGLSCGWGIWTHARGTSYLFFSNRQHM